MTRILWEIRYDSLHAREGERRAVIMKIKDTLTLVLSEHNSHKNEYPDSYPHAMQLAAAFLLDVQHEIEQAT